ncbi:MAG: hypothetical protein C5B50_00990 [Verrucomicrobia bacterium]|nr:MAG: hypothetical protein C5B50_00990 [Verrucomicrobiota bacterium]
MPKSQFQYFELCPPQKWRAGFFDEAQTKLFFFDCADCDAKEPEIAGILGTGGTYERIAVLTDSRKRNTLAMFCAPCFAKRLAHPSFVPVTPDTL